MPLAHTYTRRAQTHAFVVSTLSSLSFLSFFVSSSSFFLGLSPFLPLLRVELAAWHVFNSERSLDR